MELTKLSGYNKGSAALDVHVTTIVPASGYKSMCVYIYYPPNSELPLSDWFHALYLLTGIHHIHSAPIARRLAEDTIQWHCGIGQTDHCYGQGSYVRHGCTICPLPR